MIASPVPDMQGSREQSVWFRFQQLVCNGPDRQPPCRLLGSPQYYDTYWYTYSPITARWIRPELAANASGFYRNLLDVKRYWDSTLEAEGDLRGTVYRTLYLGCDVIVVVVVVPHTATHAMVLRC